ncbi:Rho guanine nucleotide exchange factor [Marasmius sp. AFHP31]|nr:Rho guanine nucleotide exchange factor [Marasmius sp. AFHP31]
MSLEPSLKRLEDHLTGVFNDKLRLQGFLGMKGHEAQNWLDSMQQNVRRLGDFPIAAGGFGDVWKGVIGESIELVCLKVVKVYLESDLEKLSKASFCDFVRMRLTFGAMTGIPQGGYFLASDEASKHIAIPGNISTRVYSTVVFDFALDE